jgi:4a-hydroxytetrahydrobiopterin dehydratase
MEWIVANNRLVAEVVFESQTELAELFFMIARKADEMGHHPDIFVTKAYQLRIELFTHSEGKITEKDEELARCIAEMVD